MHVIGKLNIMPSFRRTRPSMATGGGAGVQDTAMENSLYQMVPNTRNLDSNFNDLASNNGDGHFDSYYPCIRQTCVHANSVPNKSDQPSSSSSSSWSSTMCNPFQTLMVARTNPTIHQLRKHRLLQASRRSSSSSSLLLPSSSSSSFSYNVMPILLLVLISMISNPISLVDGTSTSSISSSLSSLQIHCPPVNLINRLTAPNGGSMNRYSSQDVNLQPPPPQCDCSTLQEGGWEITCYANRNVHEDDAVDEDTKSLSTNNWPGSDEFDAMEYEYDPGLNQLHYSFTVRYERVRQLVRIDCDKGSPEFKPALFQGFGIDNVDTFVISKCELPKTSLSVILYRTQTSGFAVTSTVGNHSFSINTTDQADIVSPIRTLYIKSPKRINVKHLNILLSDLESLEELKLSDFNLNDIDSYGVETYDNDRSVSGFNHHHHLRKQNDNDNGLHNGPMQPVRRSKRNEPSAANIDSFVTHSVHSLNLSKSEVGETTGSEMAITTAMPAITMFSDNDSMPEETVMTVTATASTTTTVAAPMVKMAKKIDQSNSFVPIMNMSIKTTTTSTTSTTTPLPTTSIQLMAESKESREDKIMINETATSLNEEMTTNPTIMTITPDTTNNIIDIIQPEDIINMTTRPNSEKENDGLNFEEDNINDVNLENKPIFVLDENVLNFARILPNLRVLVLEDFIEESTIPNVMFQIIKGLERLEELRLIANDLPTIPSDAFVFGGSTLRKLYMQSNSIKEINVNAFNNLSHLEILEISHNHLLHLDDYTLKPLKNLQFLRMQSNQFQNLSEYLFHSNVKLKSLDLSKNNQLRPLPSDLFQGLSSLSNLSLADCNLTKISVDERKFFRNIPSLSKLDLKGNQMSNLTRNGLFSWNAKLSKLDFSSNRIEKIDGNIFNMNSSRIIEINLEKNLLTELPEDLFNHARYVRRLSVSGNRIAATSPMTFMSLRNLEELDLSHNRIETINTSMNSLPFGMGGYLRRINLAYNNLTNYHEDILSINWHLHLSLAEMILRNNHFSGILTVPVLIASKEQKIRFDLSNNHFDSVDVQDILDLMQIKDDNMAQVRLETEVQLDNNPFNCDCFLLPFLSYAQKEKNYHETIVRKVTFQIESPRVMCHSPETLKNQPLYELQLDKLICKIDDQRVCPRGCDCHYVSYTQSAIIDCEDRNLVSIPTEFNISQHYNLSLARTSRGKVNRVDNVQFKLQKNRIESIETTSPMVLWKHDDQKLKPSFVEIYLDENEIKELNEDMIPDHYPEESVWIKTLSLENNQIEHVPLKILEMFQNASDLIEADGHRAGLPMVQSKFLFGNNPINCFNEPSPAGSECYLRDLKLLISSHPNLVDDVNSIRCDPKTVETNATSYAIVAMNDEQLCPILLPPAANNSALMALSIVCIMLASSLFVVSVLYYRNKQTILAFVYIHLNPIFICLSFTEEDLDEDKIYDAFVSYSSSDRDVVMELIEKLEKPHDMNEVSLILQNGLSIHEGKIDQIVPENVFKKSATLKSLNKSNDGNVENGEDNSYRLCIHERDWLPGNLISWNIVNSVQNSKRTILILSESFIKSIWFQVEFHTAYYQMLEDKMDRLIVIVRGQLPPKDQLDKDLNFLLTTKTYLVWGEKWFWEKLYYAMPHKKRRPMKPIKSEKDKLTSSISSNPKYNGSWNGRMNGINDGMLKWSNNSANNTSASYRPNAKAEAMKDYVDKTIASHFQLNSYTPSSTSTPTPKNNSTSLTESNPKPQPNGNGIVGGDGNRPAPKSLRNSGTLATATPNTLKAFNNYGGAGIDNKSFIDETNT